MGFEEIARQIMNDPNISKTAKVLGSIRAVGKGVEVPGGMTPAEILVEIHESKEICDQSWLALEQGALKYIWLTEVAKALPSLWKSHQEEFPDASQEPFYKDHAMGELLFFGAWRMYRSDQPELARFALDRAKIYIPDYEGVLLLEHALSTKTKVPTLHRHDSKLATDNAEFDAILHRLIEPDLRWVQ